jgi:hypothetical protein
MPASSEEEPEDVGGHYVTAGVAIAGLGSFGMLVAMLLHSSFDIEMGFINTRAMALVCLLFIVLGAWMIRSGRDQTTSS